ncbi:hypothetical protein [Streptomyces canus]|uniref:NACHT domain-containing protein n=1 Tax=Streptomyces canus TaxID=58343 RepID=UPI002DD913AC|nr:hypothetical protein [Streptomyces canus]WSD88056.1 hypothetical protein OG925_28880 [Streptomyces canus]
MNAKKELSAGRQVLREELRRLEQRALRDGRTRTDAINEANCRLRLTGLSGLSTTTVGGWFEKGSPAKDFEALWVLLQVLLEWSGIATEDELTGQERAKAVGKWASTKELWKTRWEQARTASAAVADTRLLDHYLSAARNAATRHPYPGLLRGAGLPLLTQVYVRQQARPHASESNTGVADVAATLGTANLKPADEIFQSRSRICVLLAGPGGGKSSLLRFHLASSASRWLSKDTSRAVPVLVNASAFIGIDPVPAALATACTAALRHFGLLDELTADFFRHQPRAGVPWLVMVDGLDELPDQEHRSTVLQTLTAVVAAEPALYRFVVATRPLPAGELMSLGPKVPRFELQPFAPHDLREYAAAWFDNLDEPDRHAEEFTDTLSRSRLDVLARTPLMATMLCQLYSADPTMPLPAGRAGAYQAFIELIYEQNTHKNIASTHNQAIRALKNHHQIPKDLQAAEQAAHHVRDHLPDLIDRLAHERMSGNETPTAALLAVLLPVQRPPKVKEQLWNSFLGDLVRPTGLLTQRADEFQFLHQTLLEYHAARHATSTERARKHLLHTLLPLPQALPGGYWTPPDLNPSYLGFLLDGLLAPRDGVSTQVLQRLDELTAQGGHKASSFLVDQVWLGTTLPSGPTANWLTRFSIDTALDDYLRVQAAEALARMEGHELAGANRLSSLANDATLSAYARVGAAEALAWIKGYERAGTEWLSSLADDTSLGGSGRLSAAEALARVVGYERVGADLLACLAADGSLSGYFRVQAAEALARVEGYEGEAGALFTRLADDDTLGGYFRVEANEALARIKGDERARAGRLGRLADNTILGGSARLEAARALARMEGYEPLGADKLSVLANDATLDSSFRIGAAASLARTRGHERTGLDLLTRLIGSNSTR